MSKSTRSIYLSAVKAELKSYRDELAQNLTQRGLLVKTRDNFTDDGNLLEKIEEFIRKCDVVICLVGNQYGNEPKAEEAEAFADISKGRHSYAQWEYLFGANLGKALYAFVPTDDTPRDSRNDESTAEIELQNQFRTANVDSGVNGDPIEFNDEVSLRVEALVLKELTPQVVDPQIERKLNPENPYVGFRRYTEEDTDLFFGREKLTDEIIKHVGAKMMSTVFGASGSGKSSVIRAGVIPEFKKDYPAGKVVVFNPDANPFESFANALTRAGVNPGIALPAQEPCSDVFRKVRTADPDPEQPWLIFIDQFEEIFTRPRLEDAPLVFQFVRSLIDVASSKEPLPLRIILAVRDDFIGRLTEFPGLPELADQNMIRVNRPNWQEMCELIELPAAKHGVRYEPGLVSRIASHAEGENQNLPMLQYALHRLWEVEKSDQSQFVDGVTVDADDKQMGGLHDRRINRKSYKALNGVPHALSTRLGQLFGGITIPEREQLRKAMLCLVDITKTDTAIVPVSRSAHLSEIRQAGGPDSDRLIKIMLAEGLLVESEAGEDIIELAHETLLYNCRELVKWSNDSRDAVEIRDGLKIDAKIWQAKTANNTSTFDDLWGGAQLERARELLAPDEDTGKSDFDRIGGLGDLEQDFLVASGDRMVRETRKKLEEQAAKWAKNGKSRDLLWTGPQLNRALEMNHTQAGAEQSEFERVGGVSKREQNFLLASKKQIRPKSKLPLAAILISMATALAALLTPVGEPKGEVSSGKQPVILKWIEALSGAKE